MFRDLILKVGLPVLFLAVAGIYGCVDRTFNYTQVDARIDSVRSECHFERTRNVGSSRRREWTRDMDCQVAEAMLEEAQRESDPELKGVKIVRKTDVKVRFVSPSDGQIHTVSFEANRNTVKLDTLRAGGVIPVLASRSSPEKIKQL